LTTQLDGTEVTLQTDPSLTTEQRAVRSDASLRLARCAGIDVEAAFQIEDSRQTAAQRFSAAETETAAVLQAAVQTGAGAARAVDVTSLQLRR
jgi:hypothetical protein